MNILNNPVQKLCPKRTETVPKAHILSEKKYRFVAYAYRNYTDRAIHCVQKLCSLLYTMYLLLNKPVINSKYDGNTQTIFKYEA